jgi:hypothetical protein
VSTANREKVIYLGFSAQRRTQGYNHAKNYTGIRICSCTYFGLPVIF